MRVRLHDDQGVALIVVIGATMVLGLLVAALLTFGLRSQTQARFDQDWHASQTSARAGIDDFLFRINRDSDYWMEADEPPECAECAPGLDPDNPALTGFTTIPGGDGQFSYTVDASDIGATGAIVVTSTGRVNGVERTLEARLRRRTFLDYLYFTEYETSDPVTYPTQNAQQWAADNCSRHRYDDPPRHEECRDIYWVNGDTVDGPFHTNDQIAVFRNPQWRDLATTSQPDATYYDLQADRSCESRGNPPGCTSNPQFRGGREFDDPLVLPPSNNQIKAQADPRLSGEGCMYVGATFIRLNADGSATVTSEATDDPSATKCPTDGTMTSLPPNGVIYVRGAQAGETCLDESPHPYDLDDDITTYDHCAGDVFIEGTLDGRLTIATENNVVITDDLEYEGGRGAGTDDMLGLVANNFVEIMHPVRGNGRFFWDYIGEIFPGGPITADDCDATTGGGRYCWVVAEDTDNIAYLGRNGTNTFRNPRIDAAVLAVAHSFRVQNHDHGNALGTIDLFGTIAQLYRGPVGTFGGGGNTGYLKDYNYDPRLEFISPPHFLDPVESAWKIRSQSEE